jgi:DNA helicase-2/ATP-dependent DNA helicase PcrA
MGFMCLFGPPGTGKTTRLTQAITHYADVFGPDRIVAASFTRAGARELAGRTASIVSEHQASTLHALCWHGLDHPPIAETLTVKQGWNTADPFYAMGPQAPHGDTPVGPGDEETPETLGPRLLHAYNVWRATSPESWGVAGGEAGSAFQAPDELHDFVRCWEDWKTQHGARDFTDLLVDALTVLPRAPGNPALLVLDEAQDLTPLQWRLATQWAQACVHWIVAGDDDQALYTWCGASPQPMLDAPEDNKLILGQSYRVPRQVYAYACSFLDLIATRQPKLWQPRQDEGRCEVQAEDFLTLAQGAVYETLESSQTATCALLAPCSYMLEPLVAWLRNAGVAFANPWRVRRHDWNPLAPPARGLSSRTRLLDYLRPSSRLWTWHELSTWLPLLRKRDTLQNEAETILRLHEEETREVRWEDLQTLFVPGALAGALAGDLDWLEHRIKAQYARALAYPLRIVKRWGRKVLGESPRIYVGTCHSVKGAEADTVVMTTALSRRFQMAVASGGAEADAVWRMLYVGATRARHRLVVTALPGSGRHKQ